jgi:hypothetical protein
MRQRLLGLAAALGLAALIAGVPWLLILAATRVQPRFDLGSPDGLWRALTSRDDGTLLLWLLIIVGAASWAVLTLSIVVEIASRLRRVPVPRLRGLGLPQAIARGLVAAVVGAVLTTNTSSAAPAVGAPIAAPVHPHGTTAAAFPAPQAHPETARQDTDTYVVKRGDTLWDIAEAKLGDPFAYPDIFKASRRTVQPGGRHLVDPDLIYPGWTLTIPDEDPPKKPPRVKPDPAQPPAAVTPTPLPSTPVPTPTTTAPTPQAESVAPAADEPDETDQGAPLPWMLTGLAGAGSLLAGGLLLGLRRRRAAQSHTRRPGRTLPVPPPALAPVEQTLMHQGDLTADIVERVFQTTQRLALHLHATGRPIPLLTGIDVTHEHLAFRFADPAELDDPWQPDPDRHGWRLAHDTDLDLLGPCEEDREAPWPTLVTVGQDTHGWRLLNLEALGAVTLTGDPLHAEDLARAWIAELAIAPWARDVDITRNQLFAELDALHPQRFDHTGTHDITAGLIESAHDTQHWLAEYAADRPDIARARQAGPELWIPRLLVTTHPGPERLDELIGLVTTRPGHTGITVVTIGSQGPVTRGVEVHLTGDGRVQLPQHGLDLVANGITRDEAAGCAAVLVAADELADTPVPDPEPDADWQQHCDAAGHLHADLTVARTTTLGLLDATSLLPDPDATYLTSTANTAADLAEIAPLIPTTTTARVKDDDPTLDRDLADWWTDSTDRPRLTILGPVRLRLGRGGSATTGLKRVPYYTEIVAYLATRPHGATADELADALGIGAERVRRDLTIVRARLGTNPRTGRPYLPDALANPEADARGVGVYLLEDVLCDANLFRRLRLRGEASGANGTTDLSQALCLVNGIPYDQLRRRGGLWLGQTHDDHHITVGIVDVAHLLTTHALAAGDLKRARAAAEIAHAVAPNEATPQLDLATIAEHEGRPAEAARIAREITDWNDHSGYGPIDPGERSDAILRAHRWLEPRSGVG